MVDPKQYLDAGLFFHGHKCPAMPMGLLVVPRYNRLGVGAPRTVSSLPWWTRNDHCATCFADGSNHYPVAPSEKETSGNLIMANGV